MTHAVDLTGKIAVVTGAGSGIGRATACLLARQGARVHVADVNPDGANAVAAEIEAAGGAAVAHVVDVADPDAVEAFAAAVFDAEHYVDILHNNAGIGHAGNIEATTIEDWQRVIGVNLLGVAFGVQTFVPRMLAQGRPATVVNTASEAGLVPTARMAPYTTSKFGVVGMSEALNAELAPKGIRVIAVCPGIINTAIVRTGVLRGETAELHDKAIAFYSKRGASPDVVAEAVLKAIDKPKLIVPVPKSHVLVPYLLHRLSPRLVQPLSRQIMRLMSLG
jgi:NAD(P)-dependent dehydrogenase (short-subunit alcohol dehydrogenase family)